MFIIFIMVVNIIWFFICRWFYDSGLKEGEIIERFEGRKESLGEIEKIIEDSKQTRDHIEIGNETKTILGK